MFAREGEIIRRNDGRTRIQERNGGMETADPIPYRGSDRKKREKLTDLIKMEVKEKRERGTNLCGEMMRNCGGRSSESV